MGIDKNYIKVDSSRLGVAKFDTIRELDTTNLFINRS